LNFPVFAMINENPLRYSCFTFGSREMYSLRKKDFYAQGQQESMHLGHWCSDK
jgi:hypothetical protein